MSHAPIKEPSFAKSFLASVIVHGLIILGVLFLAKPKPLPDVVSLQASLVGSDGLADIEGQIAKAYADNQAKNQINTQVSTPTTTPTRSDYQSDFAEREQAYQAQMQAYAEALDQEIASELHAYRDALTAEDLERQRQVKELENRERSNDEIARENAKELSKAHEQQKAQATSSKSHTADLSGDDSPTPPTVGQGQGQHGAGSGSSGNEGNAGSSGGGGKSSVISGIQERIHRNWSPEAGLKGKRLTATIRLDSSGNLTDIQFGSGDSSLKPSLERAIRASAPFPEAVGVLTNFTANFYAD